MGTRQIIEARLGRPLGPMATMPKDTRQAIYLLALQLVRPGNRRPIHATTRRPILP